MKLLHQPGEIIAQRYRIINTLGQGGIGITYQALDLNTNQQVALKALSLRQMNEWKKIELFEREAQILSELNHPAIPHYLDYFQVDTATDRYFYIAQQLAPGKSLAELVETGWRPNETEVKKIVIKVLEILVYLQSLTPPVIHRDIKPQNIIITPDKQVFIVDFGAVQDTYHNTVTGGSTIVGTFGYMAPEQCRGQAVLSTDLYGLGNTILFLLTGKSPEKLPIRNLKLNFRSQVRVSPQFANWLEKMLEPAIEDRFTSASVALAVLEGKQAITNYSSENHYKPKESKITLRKTADNLMIEIPSPGLRNNFNQMFAFFLLIWNFCLFGSSLLILLFLLRKISNSYYYHYYVYPVSEKMISDFLIELILVLTLPAIIQMCFRLDIMIDLSKIIWFRINTSIGVTSIYWTMVAWLNNIYIFLFMFSSVTGTSCSHGGYFCNGILGVFWIMEWIIIFIDIVLVLWVQRRFLISLKRKINLEITSDKFLLKSSLMNQKKCPKFEYYTELIKPILCFLGLPMGENPITDISLTKKLSKNGFCSLRSRLTQDEKEWLAWEINNYLKDKNMNT